MASPGMFIVFDLFYLDSYSFAIKMFEDAYQVLWFLLFLNSKSFFYHIDVFSN